MKKKIRSFEEIKNEAVLFLIMLFVCFFRFTLMEDVVQLLYGEALITNVSTEFGLVKSLENFDKGLYAFCVALVLLIFLVYFIFFFRFIKSQENKDRAMYICTVFTVIPMGVFSAVSRDNFSIIMLVSVFVAGVCMLLCENERLCILLPALLLLSAIVSPVCVCIVFPMIMFPLKSETENSRKQTFHKTAYVLCMIEYAVCAMMIIITYLKTPYFVKEFVVPCIITVLLCIPVVTPIISVLKESEKKFILMIFLLSVPTLLFSTDTRVLLMSTVSGMIFAVMHLLKKENTLIKDETDKLFKWFESHTFLSCCYLIYCCVLSASSLGAIGDIAKNLLRYIVL